MIVVRLREGLGNQMFQYAAARALALRTGQELRLDLSWFERSSGHRAYRLDAFGVEAAEVDDDLAGPLRELRSRLGVRPASQDDEPAGGDLGLTLYGEVFHGFRPEVVDAPGDAYLCGHWQSEKYFLDHEAAIRRDFTFRGPLSDTGRELAEEIEGCEAVAVHVRRGDYERDPRVRAVMGLRPPEYYERAVARVAGETGAERFFVFTDDPAWVREELLGRLPGAELARGGSDVEDLRLMTLCRHHVIANSTFSWWGAWLAASPGQVVVAPERWMARPLGTTDHIVPERWLRL